MEAKQNKSETDFNKWIVIVLALLFVVSIAGLFVIHKYFTLDDKSFGREVGNTFLEIISVGVIGTILSLLLAKYNQQQEKLQSQEQAAQEASIREERNTREDSIRKQELNRISDENRNQFIKNVLHELNEIYTGTKSARRMLRAKAFIVSYKEAIKNDNTIIDVKIYDHYLEKINNYQLELETILSEINTDATIFRNHIQIQSSINQMQEYLHSLVKEYEDHRFNASTDPGPLTIKPLDKIKELVNHAKENGALKVKFIYPYKKAIAAIRKDLIEGNKNNLSSEQNKAIVRKFFEEVCNKGNKDLIPKIFATNVSFNGKTDTSDGVKKHVEDIKSAFDNAHVLVNKQIAEDDWVSTMRTWEGVQVTDYNKTPATNKLMTWREISFVRLENGKIVEDWVLRSELAVAGDDNSKISFP